MERERKLAKALNNFSKDLQNKILRANVNTHNQKEALNRDKLFNLLIEGIGNLEPRLRVIDQKLIITRQPLDILAIDSIGQLVIIELEEQESEAIVLRALEHFDWILHNIRLLSHKYSKEKIDISLAPRIILVSKCFRETFLRKLTYINTTRIDVYEYSLQDLDGIEKLIFTPRVFTTQKPKIIDITKQSLEDLLLNIKDNSVRRLCRILIEEIHRKFAGSKIETSAGYIELKRNARVFVRIYPLRNFFWVSLNPQGAWRGIKISEEKVMLEVLELLKNKVRECED